MARGAVASMFKAERDRLVAEGKGRQEGRLFIVEVPSKNPSFPDYVHLRVWRGNQAKPFINWLMKPDAAAREIQQQIDYEKSRDADNAKWEAEKAAKVAEAKKIPVGTLLHGSWGYDQTQCELYQVVGRPSPSKVEVREVGYTVVNPMPHGMSEYRKPKKDDLHGPVLTLTIGRSGGIKLNDHCYLTPCSEDSTHYASWYA